MKTEGLMITIITAAWNAEGVWNAIRSIDNQTYKNWHHIIVNDNNPDVRKALHAMCAHEKRMYIDIGFRTHFYGALARNMGAISAFSYVHHSKRDIENEWVTFHDDDNRWEPWHLEDMVAAKLANPDASIIATDAMWVGAKDKKWIQHRPIKLKHGSCDLGQFMYKTRLFRDYGYFFPHPRRKHKWDWELIKKMTKGEKGAIAYTNKPSFIMNYKKR